jgi:hypothetical protein
MVRWNRASLSSNMAGNPSNRSGPDRTVPPNWTRIENIFKGIEFPVLDDGSGGGTKGSVAENWRLVEDTTSQGRTILKLQYIGGTEPKTVQIFQA